MTTSTSPSMARAFVPTEALAKRLDIRGERLSVELTDGRVLSVPLKWFPLLDAATPEQRAAYEIGAGGRSLHWPEIDEDLCVANLLAGGDAKAA